MSKTCSVFKIKDDKGHIKECEVLYLFTPKNSDKNYIVYTDNSVDEAGSKRVYANIYRETGEKKELLPFKIGAVKMAYDTNSEIIPFAIIGKYKVFKRGKSNYYLCLTRKI